MRVFLGGLSGVGNAQQVREGEGPRAVRTPDRVAGVELYSPPPGAVPGRGGIDMAGLNGRFVWYELLTSNVEAAKAFYGEVVGWTAKDAPGPMAYTLLCVGEARAAGLMLLPDEAKKMGAPPSWLGYLGVDNAEQAVSQVVELGGRQMGHVHQMPGVGSFAVIADPEGAVIGLFALEMTNAPDRGAPGVGEVAWNELNTTDHASAWKFYSKLAGWKHTESFEMGPEMGTYFMFESGKGERTRGGMSNMAKVHGFPPHWTYYIGVPDIDAAARRTESLGGTVMNGPMEVPGGDMVVQARDPQGAAFALYMKKA